MSSFVLVLVPSGPVVVAVAAVAAVAAEMMEAIPAGVVRSAPSVVMRAWVEGLESGCGEKEVGVRIRGSGAGGADRSVSVRVCVVGRVSRAEERERPMKPEAPVMRMDMVCFLFFGAASSKGRGGEERKGADGYFLMRARA